MIVHSNLFILFLFYFVFFAYFWFSLWLLLAHIQVIQRANNNHKKQKYTKNTK